MKVNKCKQRMNEKGSSTHDKTDRRKDMISNFQKLGLTLISLFLVVQSYKHIVY